VELVRAEDPIVSLSWGEVLIAAQVGVARNIIQMQAGKKHYLHPAKPWEQNITGAIAEMAACKLFGVYWSGALAASALGVDIAPDIQIKFSSHGNGTGDLKLQPPQVKPDHRYFLVVPHIEAPQGKGLRFAGWLFGREIAQEKHWKKDLPLGCLPGFWVSQNDLRVVDRPKVLATIAPPILQGGRE
jgi:hypothetical protein